jgi:hypothetical protein
MKKWKKQNIDKDELENFLNSLEQEGSKVQSVTLDQATGDFVVIYWVEDAQLFSD